MLFENDHKPDLLFLAHRVPYPLDKGDRIRTFHILRLLAERASIHLACLADEPVTPEAVSVLSGFCRRLEIVPIGNKVRLVRGLASFVYGRSISEGAFASWRLRRTLQRWTGEIRFHAAMVSASSMAPYLRMLRPGPSAAVVDAMDVDSQKWLDYARGRAWPMSWILRAEGQRLRRLEHDICTWARAVTLVSRAETDLFRSFCPWEEVHAVTNGVDLAYFRPATGVVENDSCVFVGALDYFPNVDAAVWFCREVWPGIRRRRPQATLDLVGRRPTPAVRRLAEEPGVRLVGQVPDVRPYVNQAAVAVVPLRIARGLQNKVLEALALGKAVVASPAALAALQVQPGVDLLAATTAEEWVSSVTGLLESRERRRELGTRGRQYVVDHHDWDHCLEPLLDLLDLAGAGTSGRRDREFCR
jgi:sugar transferase (PEP-CTERM/EpsH1 system associated)